MLISKKILAFSGFILTCTALSSAAFGAEWDTKQVVSSDNEAIFTTASSETAVTLLCLNGKLRAAVSTSGIEGADILSVNGETRRRINRDVTLTIGDEEGQKSNWRINPSAEIYVTPSRKEAVMLFNAAISQKPISIQRKGKGQFNFLLPSPNAIFANFGGSCGVGKNSQTAQ